MGACSVSQRQTSLRAIMGVLPVAGLPNGNLNPRPLSNNSCRSQLSLCASIVIPLVLGVQWQASLKMNTVVFYSPTD